MGKKDLSKSYEQLGDVDFKPVLEPFAWTGLATQAQLETATAKSRNPLKRIIARLLQLHILTERPLPGKALKTPGRASALYMLAETGADILRDLRIKNDARACRLDDPADIDHAICVTEMAARAFASHLGFAVERPIQFGDNEPWRPDLAITLPTGEQADFELERRASAANTLHRLVDKLRRLSRFFQSPQARGFSRDIRVLFNITRTQWPATRRIWLKAVAAVAAEMGGALPFQVMGCLLADFLTQPNWNGVETFENLLDPSLLSVFGAPSAEDQAKQEPQPQAPGDIVPSSNMPAPVPALTGGPRALTSMLYEDLRVYKAALLQDDHTLLNAYVNVLQDEFESLQVGSPASFLRLMELIHQVSHNQARPPAARAGLPIGSLFMLRTYLDQPSRADLKQAIRARQRSIRAARYSGINMVRDEMTKMLWDVFLRYHGIGRSDLLQVNVQLPNDHRSELHITAKIFSEDLLIDDDGVLPRNEVKEAERALEWVLEALLVYADLLGLNTKD